MKFLVAIAFTAVTAAAAQTPAAGTPGSNSASITVQSNLIVVPALVRTREGGLVYTLKAEDFLLTDNGVEQKLHLEEDTGGEPLALVICVETGGIGAGHLNEYRNLGAMLDSLTGVVDHKVAVVGFDSTPTLLHGFTDNVEFVVHSLNELDEGDAGAAIFDALTFSVDLLHKQPTKYRRAILLLSETLDRGSHTQIVDALHAISDTNTAIYSIAFNPTKAELDKEARKFGLRPFFPPTPPGPQHGCFSHDNGTDAEGKPIPPAESRAVQNFDCAAVLMPPLRLAKLAEIAASNGMQQNAPEAVARQTGGESFKFKDAKTLQQDLFTISNHIANHYVLSFHPQSPQPGFHQIKLQLRNYTGLSVEARDGYWLNSGDAVVPSVQPVPPSQPQR